MSRQAVRAGVAATAVTQGGQQVGNSHVYTCALPGCGAQIEAPGSRPARLYCSPEHRRSARRMRAEHARPDEGQAAEQGPSGPAPVPSSRRKRDDGAARPRLRAVAVAAELTHDALVRPPKRPAKRAPGRWREMTYYGAAPGQLPSDEPDPELIRDGLRARARAPLGGPHRVAVISLKGGVGKTTVAAGLGLSLAEARGDRVVAIDGSPNPSTLADRLSGPAPRSVRDLLRSAGTVRSLGELSHYTALAGRLAVLASDQDPRSAGGFDGEDHSRATALLSRFYNIVITDCGTGLMHSAARNAVAEADSLVVVGAPALDGASRAAATLDWLAAHGLGDKARAAVVALTRDRESPQVLLDPVLAHFRARVRAVLEIPHDPHLVAGGRIDVGELRAATRDSFLELAALVGDGFVAAGGPAPECAGDTASGA